MAHWRERGGGWVVGQLLLLALAALAPQRGPRWPRAVALSARLLALPALGIGGWLLARAPAALGANLTPFPRPQPEGTLVREGIYAEVRHPLYGGLMLVACGWALLTTNTLRLVCAGLLAAFLDMKAGHEEGWLVERFPDYAAYQDEVPRFFPNPW